MTAFVSPAPGELPAFVPDDLPHFPGNAPARREPPRPLFRPSTTPEPYPVAATGPLAEVTKAIIALTQAPPGICANSVLAAAALATQAHADVRLPGTERPRPITLYLLSIAGSGERKTTADREALIGVRNRERDLREIAKEADGAFRNATEAYDAARAEVVKRGKGDLNSTRATLDTLGNPPARPTRPILLMTEPTVEGLVKLLADSPPTVGLFSSEGGSFLGGHALSDEARLRSGARLSSLWDGEPIDRVRSGDGSTVIVGRRVALHLMAQPDAAARFLSDPTLRDQGLLSRFLISSPAPTAGTRMFRAASLETMQTIEHFARTIEDLLRSIPPTNEDGGLRTLTVEGLARARFIGFHDAVEKEIAPAGRLASIKGFASKLAEHAGRIAAVLSLVADPTCQVVSPDAMSNGVHLANHYAGEALRLGDDARIADQLRVAEKLRLWLIEKNKAIVFPAEVYQTGPAELRSKAEALAAIRILADHGYLSPMHGAAGEPAVVDGVSRREAWRVLDADGYPVGG